MQNSSTFWPTSLGVCLLSFVNCCFPPSEIEPDRDSSLVPSPPRFFRNSIWNLSALLNQSVTSRSTIPHSACPAKLLAPFTNSSTNENSTILRSALDRSATRTYLCAVCPLSGGVGENRRDGIFPQELFAVVVAEALGQEVLRAQAWVGGRDEAFPSEASYPLLC